LGLADMLDLSALGMESMSNLTNNKQIGQLSTLVVRREKRKKKTQTMWQFNHYLSIRATSCGRGLDLVTRKHQTYLFNGTGATHTLEKK